MRCLFGDDGVMKAIDMDFIVVGIILRGKIKRICIKDTLHVPKLKANLPLVRKLLLSGLKVQFKLNECIVRNRDKKCVAISLCKGNLYQINFDKMHVADATNLMQLSTKVGGLEL